MVRMQSADPPPQQAVVGVFAFQIGPGLTAVALVFNSNSTHSFRADTPHRDFGLPPRTLDLILAVTHDFAFDEIDHLFGDVGGMIGDALQVP